jgi:hypothetical protein
VADGGRQCRDGLVASAQKVDHPAVRIHDEQDPNAPARQAQLLDSRVTSAGRTVDERAAEPSFLPLENGDANGDALLLRLAQRAPPGFELIRALDQPTHRANVARASIAN